MKLSKVEIQAFRIYDKIEDGTFDFHTDKGEVADFVSIFAPNGFGKTSFYDAIEWAFTNQVHRLSTERDWIEKDRQEGHLHGSQKGRDILRNKESDLSIHTKVTIEGDSGDPIYNQITKRPKSNSTDIDLGERGDPRLHSFFRKVLLEQEAIDAFLRVVKPAEKYAEWASYFSDEKTENYYKTICNLALLNDERIAQHQKELKGVAVPGTAPDASLLVRLNEQIKAIQSHGIDLKLVDETFDNAAWVEFTTRLNGIRVDTSSALKVAEMQVENFQEAIAGSRDIVGVRKYLEIPVEIKENDAELRLMRNHEKVLTVLAADEETSVRLKSEISDQKLQLNRFEDLSKRYPAFSTIKNSISQMQIAIADSITKLETFENSKADIGEKLISADSVVKELEQSVNVVRSGLEDLPRIKDEITGLETELGKLANEKNAFQAETKRLQTKFLVPLESRLASFERAIAAISDNNFEIKVEKGLSKDLAQLKLARSEESGLEKDLESVEIRIGHFKALSTDLENLVSLGLDIVGTTGKSVCPLCSYDHGTHKQLLDSLKSSTALTVEGDALSKERSRINRQLKDTRSSIIKVKAETKDRLETQKKLTQVEISNTQELIAGITSKVDVCNTELLDTKARITVLKSGLLGLEPDQFLKQEAGKSASLEEKINEESLKRDALRKEESEIDQEIAIEESRVARSRKSLTGLEDDPVYKRFITDSVALHIDISSPAALKTKTTGSNSRLSKLEKQSADVLAKINATRKTIPKVTAGTVTKRIEVLLGRIEELTAKKAAFEAFVSEELDLVIGSRKSLPKKLEDGRTLAAARADATRELLHALEKAQLNEASIKPFLEYWSLQKRRQSLETQLSKNTRLKGIIEDQRQRLSEQLGASVIDFFDEELINSIYRAIDPHPVYDTVKFVCKFEEREPTLDVVVRDKKDSAVPNLYFSAAQINVLSLSIFLARALKAVSDDKAPVRCIFVDDPVQSMDSINILSTIDLFRSIVLNQDIQIILSTHDENFHNLLRRKIPAERFRSRFIELETYGKVGPRTGSTP